MPDSQHSSYLPLYTSPARRTLLQRITRHIRKAGSSRPGAFISMSPPVGIWLGATGVVPLPLTTVVFSSSLVRGHRLEGEASLVKRHQRNRPTELSSSGGEMEDPGANGDRGVPVECDPITELWCDGGWEWVDAA